MDVKKCRKTIGTTVLHVLQNTPLFKEAILLNINKRPLFMTSAHCFYRCTPFHKKLMHHRSKVKADES